MTPRWSRENRARRTDAATPEEQSQAPAEPDEQQSADPTGEPGPGDSSLQELTAMAESLLAQATELRRQTQALADELAEHDPSEAAPEAAGGETAGGETAGAEATLGGAAAEPAADEAAVGGAAAEPAGEAASGEPAAGEAALSEPAGPEATLGEAATAGPGADEPAQAEPFASEPMDPEPAPAVADHFAGAPQEQAPAEPAPQRESVSGMRIVAVNMAAAGRSREEAASYLRDTFGEEPSQELLDEVFAGGS